MPSLVGGWVQGFSAGPDGGRDARFDGTAQEIPSRAALWKGKIIVQAKHTSKINAKFSEPDFYNAKNNNNSAIITGEIPKIKKLLDDKELDYYLLFSNRDQSGNIESDVRRFISEKTGLADNRIMLCGNELMEGWLKMFPEVVRETKIDLIDCPLNVSPKDLAEVILLLDKYKEEITSVTNLQIPPRTPLAEKVKLNEMTEEYAEQIRKHIPNFGDIQNFLESVDESRERYEAVVEEFNAKIIATRTDFPTFDKVIEYIFDLCTNRDPDLSGYKRRRLLRQLLYYMFWFCDIGRNK